MKYPIVPLLFIVAIAFAPLAVVAQTTPSTPVKPPALSPQQLNDGLKAGLTAIISQALVADAIKVEMPTVLAKAEPGLVKNNKGALVTDFTKALAETMSKVTPKAFDLIKSAMRDVKVENAPVLLSGGPDAGTQFLRKAAGSSLRMSVLSAVKQATSGSGLVTKARTALAATNPYGVNGVDNGARMLVTLEDYICDQVINQSFKLITEKEAIVRANPALLTGNALAKKVFETCKK